MADPSRSDAWNLLQEMKKHAPPPPAPLEPPMGKAELDRRAGILQARDAAMASVRTMHAAELVHRSPRER